MGVIADEGPSNCDREQRTKDDSALAIFRSTIHFRSTGIKGSRVSHGLREQSDPSTASEHTA